MSCKSSGITPTFATILFKGALQTLVRHLSQQLLIWEPDTQCSLLPEDSRNLAKRSLGTKKKLASAATGERVASADSNLTTLTSIFLQLVDED